MRILDINDKEIFNPDLKTGHLIEDKILIAHHPAVEYSPGKFHYETVAFYPNGGTDVERVIDEPEVKGQDAWDEYEPIYRYLKYTEAELEQMGEEKEQIKKIRELEQKVENMEKIILEQGV